MQSSLSKPVHPSAQISLHLIHFLDAFIEYPVGHSVKHVLFKKIEEAGQVTHYETKYFLLINNAIIVKKITYLI